MHSDVAKIVPLALFVFLRASYRLNSSRYYENLIYANLFIVFLFIFITFISLWAICDFMRFDNSLFSFFRIFLRSFYG